MVLKSIALSYHLCSYNYHYYEYYIMNINLNAKKVNIEYYKYLLVVETTEKNVPY